MKLVPGFSRSHAPAWEWASFCLDLTDFFPGQRPHPYLIAYQSRQLGLANPPHLIGRSGFASRLRKALVAGRKERMMKTNYISKKFVSATIEPPQFLTSLTPLKGSD